MTATPEQGKGSAELPLILVADPIAESGVDRLEEVAQVEDATGASPGELVERIPRAAGLVVRSGTDVTRELIEAGGRLRIIGRAGVGVNNIDIEAATERGVFVANVPGGNTVSAAEHTWALLLALVRNVTRGDASLRRGKWERKALTGMELEGKTMGIVGFGRIGREVARRAQGFDLTILAHDPYVTGDTAGQYGAELVALDELLGRSDIVSLHAPLNDQTRGLLGAKELRQVKQGAVLVNCARGGLVDQRALYEALTEGHVAAAALDVFAEEPPHGDPLLELDEVVVTPHLGASTREAQAHTAAAIAAEVRRVLQGGYPTNPVNLPAFPEQRWETVSGFLQLAEVQGRFLAQAFPGAVTAVRLQVLGDVPERSVELMTKALLAGLLAGTVSDRVNMVNAPVIAGRRGIRVDEARTPGAAVAQPVLAAQVVTEAEEVSVHGTLTPAGAVRFTGIDGLPADMTPSPAMLVAENRDEPGVIGAVGTLLGEDGVNIAGMQVARREPGGRAVMVLTVDDTVEEDTMARVRELSGIRRAALIDLRGALLGAKGGQPPAGDGQVRAEVGD